MNQALSGKDFYTVEEYLAFERSSELKHEYISGEIVAMAGATRAHNLITGNIAQRLRNQLEGKPYETYSNDIMIASIGCTLTLAEIYARVEFPPSRPLKSVQRESQGREESE